MILFNVRSRAGINGEEAEPEWSNPLRRGIIMALDEFEISTDKRRLDVAMIHDFLANRSYWASGIPLQVVNP